jgi:hypothetical protein
MILQLIYDFVVSSFDNGKKVNRYDMQPREQVEYRLNMKLSVTSQMNSVILPEKPVL